MPLGVETEVHPTIGAQAVLRPGCCIYPHLIYFHTIPAALRRLFLDQLLCVFTLHVQMFPTSHLHRLYLDQLPERLSSLEVQNAVVAVSGGGRARGGGEAAAGEGVVAGTDAGAGAGAAGAMSSSAALARLASRISNAAMMKGACHFVMRGPPFSNTHHHPHPSLVCPGRASLPPSHTPRRPSLIIHRHPLDGTRDWHGVVAIRLQV